MAECPALKYIPEGRESDYKGLSLDTILFPNESIDKIMNDLELYPSDVLLTGYPKTGTTWLQEIICLICNGADTVAAAKTPLVDRIRMLELCIPGAKPYVDQIMDDQPPRLMTTHLPYRMLSSQINKGKPKVIYLMRNPKDTLVSKFHFYNTRPGITIPTFGEFFELVRHDKIVFGDFFDHVIPFWENHKEDGILIVRYEDLKRDHLGGVKRIAEYLEKNLSDEQIQLIVDHTTFDSMKSRKGVKQGGMVSEAAPKEKDNAFLRKGAVGGWREFFTEEQNVYINKKHDETLKGTGLSFEECC